ncbi:MAG TPA: PfkB family carbohydrate kinase, partial [Thermomonospora sp.]|nr:PfkB family carbohydrate kinase [Thermomonospora sp.]
VAARVVDSTGAGDAFAAGFLAAVLQGADEPSALAAACRAGALAVTRVGGRPGEASGADGATSGPAGSAARPAWGR